MSIFTKVAEKARWKAIFTEPPLWAADFMEENRCPEYLMVKFASSTDTQLTRALAYYTHLSPAAADILSHSDDPRTVMPVTSKVTLPRLSELINTKDPNILFVAARRQDLTPSQYRTIRALGDDRTQKTLDTYQFAAAGVQAERPVMPSLPVPKQRQMSGLASTRGPVEVETSQAMAS